MEIKKYMPSLLGWLGTVLIVGALAANSFGAITPAGAFYPLMNLFGAIGITYNALTKKTFLAVAFGLAWITISIATLIQHKDVFLG